MIIDLESISAADFFTEASLWAIYNQACSPCNKTFTIPANSCNMTQETIFGGPNTVLPRWINSVYFWRTYPISYLYLPIAIEFDFWTFYNTVEDNPSSFSLESILWPSGFQFVQISTTIEDSCIMDFSVPSQGVVIKSFYKFHARIFVNHTQSNYLIINFSVRSTLPSALIALGSKNLKVYMNSNILINSPIIAENFPCQISEYWNGSACANCHASCSVCSGMSENQCSTCLAGYYYYQNGTCLGTCPSPRKIQDGDLCANPCSSDEDYFYETDQVCKLTCESPYQPQTIDTIKICFLSVDLTIEEVQKAQDLVTSLASQAKATGTAMKTTSAFSSSNPNLALLAGQASMLFYIRYIDVKYSAKLSLILTLQDSSPFSFSFGISMPKALDGELKTRPLPTIFERYELHSNFLWNSWDTLSSLMIALLSVLVVSILRAVMPKYWIFEAILLVLKWNIPLMVICSAFGDLYFDASLQFHAGLSGSIWEILSFFLAIIMIIIGIALALIIAKIVKEIRKNHEKGEKKWRDFGLLFESYRRTSFFTLGYMGLFMVESMLFNLVLANLYNYPLLEISLITGSSLLMFLYLVFQAPFKERLEFVQLLWNKLLLMTVNICVLILAIMDKLKIVGQDLRNNLGEAIIIIFTIFSISSLVFMSLGLLQGAFAFYKFLKKLKSQGVPLTPLRILKILLKRQDDHSPGFHVKEKVIDLSTSMTPSPQRKRRIKRPDRNKNQKVLTVKPADNINTSSQGLNVDISMQQNYDYSFDSINPPGENLGHSRVVTSNFRRKFNRKEVELRRNKRLDFEKNHDRISNAFQNLPQSQERRKLPVKTLKPLIM